MTSFGFREGRLFAEGVDGSKSPRRVLPTVRLKSVVCSDRAGFFAGCATEDAATN